MIRVIGKDPNGIPRVWGEGKTFEEAHRQASNAANEYCIGRPDCRPIILEQETGRANKRLAALFGSEWNGID